MRLGFLLLASCGVVGAAFGLAAASDPNPFGDANVFDTPTTPARFPTNQGRVEKSISAKDASRAPSLTDPIATDAQDPSDDPFRTDSAPGKSARRSAGSLLDGSGEASQGGHGSTQADGKKRRDSQVIHAEYQRRFGESERQNIRQVRANAPVFDDGADKVSRERRSAQSPNKPRHLGAHKSLTPGTSGGIDAAQAPAVSVQWVKKSPISVGQECACDLVVRNAGKTAAQDVAVEAYFPATIRLTRAEPMPKDNQDHVTWAFPSLAAGEERIIHIKLIPSKRGDLATTAQVRFTETASNVFLVEEPLLNLAMRGPKELMVGDPATQTITINNPGTGTAHNVVIEARVTKGLEHPRGEKLTIQVGSLNAGESRVVRLPLVAVAGGEQSVAIQASAGNDLHAQMTTRFHVVAPSVKVAVEGPTLRYVGRKATYVVNVTNDGGVASNNVRVTHKLPEGFRFVRADKGGEFDDVSRTINWFIGHMDVKESVRMKVELATTQIGTFTHAFAAVSEQGARSDARLETVVDGTASLEVEIIDQNDPVEVGVETAYEIHVRNDGSKAAENVAIACELASAVELLRAEGGATSRDSHGLLTFRPIPTLEPGKTAIYRLHVKGKNEGNHRLTVRLSADSIKEPLIYEEMTKFYAE